MEVQTATRVKRGRRIKMNIVYKVLWYTWVILGFIPAFIHKIIKGRWPGWYGIQM
jgi:hypothetical protein